MVPNKKKSKKKPRVKLEDVSLFEICKTCNGTGLRVIGTERYEDSGGSHNIDLYGTCEVCNGLGEILIGHIDEISKFDMDILKKN